MPSAFLVCGEWIPRGVASRRPLASPLLRERDRVLNCSHRRGDVGKARPASSPIRFAAFEVDLETGELRRNGKKLTLQEQPFQVLAALLERPGQLLTRDELQHKVWASDTFVDFDRGINKAINR